MKKRIVKKYTRFIQFKTVPIPLIVFLVSVGSNLVFGPVSVSAQESQNLVPQTTQNKTQTFHGTNPCFGQHGTYGTHRLGAHGNQSGYAARNFGQFGNYTGIHHFTQSGNRTAYMMMHPCLGQNGTQTQGSVNIPSTSILQNQIPSWIKNNAKWWSSGSIDDSTFAQGIQYMIQQGIVKIPPTHSVSSTGVKIPQWVRSDAAYWSRNQIDDSTFVGAIQYLVQSGIISA